MPELSIGILGAGKLGTTLARLGVHAGLPILIGSRRPVADLQWVVDTLAPGAKTLSAQEVVAQADVIILALPLSHYRDLDPHAFAGKLVLDAMNYWQEVDGTENTISDLTRGSSEVVQAWLADSFVAKAFNHMGYHDLEIEVERKPTIPRAMAYATDHDRIRSIVERVITAFGFAPLDLGPMRFGLLLEPGSPLFGEAIPVPDFQTKLADIYNQPFGQAIIAERGSKIV